MKEREETLVKKDKDKELDVIKVGGALYDRNVARDTVYRDYTECTVLLCSEKLVGKAVYAT